MALPKGIRSIPGVCDLLSYSAPGADPARPALFFELPHGATRTQDYRSLRARLSPELPEDLIDYFHVNTDVGSTELACRVAELLTRPESGCSRPCSVLVLRCLLPRTFIDTNRTLEAEAGEATSVGLTAATAEYIRDDADARLLQSLYHQYHGAASAAYGHVCGAGGLAMTAHTFAPRSIRIETFDEGIGRALRRAYEPEVYERWKRRPAVDIISRDAEGRDLSPRSLVDDIRQGYGEIGIEATENEVYSLHPVSMGYHYATRHAGRVLCIEIARDRLAEPFSPFEEMKISGEKVSRMAGPIAAAFRRSLAAGS